MIIFRKMAISAVYITIDTMENASRLAGGLVQARLAACVNIIPGVRSVYMWEGQVHDDAELLLMVKTKTGLVPNLTQWVKENHPYDCPEVISVPITEVTRRILSL